MSNHGWQAATVALASVNATRWIRFEIAEEDEDSYRQEQRGRPGKDTRYRKTSRLRHRVTWHVDETLLAHDAASDGCWPLITNDRDMTGDQLLAAYTWQPNLEKRHAQLKGTQLVAPMFLRDPARILEIFTSVYASAGRARIVPLRTSLFS